MFTPTIEAIGKVVMCRAENGQIPGSAIEDTFKLNINCKYFVCVRAQSSTNLMQVLAVSGVYNQVGLLIVMARIMRIILGTRSAPRTLAMVEFPHCLGPFHLQLHLHSMSQ